MNEADNALYLTKDHGRNQIVISGSENRNHQAVIIPTNFIRPLYIGSNQSVGMNDN